MCRGMRDRSRSGELTSRRLDLGADTAHAWDPRALASPTVSAEVEDALSRVVAQLPAGGEARPGQVEMATAVAKAIEAGRPLCAQAGTGTGKSLAYLVPTILSGKRVVVATATKALQDQLAGKDLPFLSRHLDEPFVHSVLKGRSNYLCRQRLVEMERDGDQMELAGGETTSRLGKQITELLD